MMNADDLAALRERQVFLLRSIADLDAEAAAGDLSPDDYAALRDDYVARAAAVTRAVAGGTPLAAAPSAPSKLRGRAPLIVAACIALASVAGLGVAASSGSRTAGAPLSGSLPTTTRERLALAARLAGEGEAVEAVKLYDRVLDDDPTHPVALAYRGWLVRLAGLRDEGLAYVERAVSSDPTYPDAHFFRGMMLWQDKADPAAAVAEFRLFLSNNPPQAMVKVVEDALRRAAAEAGLPTS